MIREPFDPLQIATAYARHGATCISVLTDEPYFQGRLEYLAQIRSALQPPLLRKDFPELYRHAKELGLLVTVFTNGTLIDERIAALWEELPPYLVEISLYGITRQTYEKVVSVPGSFDRCLAGIHRVIAGGHPLALKAPATRDNVHEIPEMQAFANDLGVDIFHITHCIFLLHRFFS